MLSVDKLVGSPLTQPWAASATQEFDLPRTYVFESILLRLAGTLTLASYSVAPTKFVESVENLIALVSVIATRKYPGGVQDTIKAVDLAYLRQLTHMMEATDVPRTDIGTTNTAYAFTTQGRIYFREPRLGKTGKGGSERESMLDSRLLSALKLDVLFRDQTAMVTGGTGGTATLSATTVSLLARVFQGSIKAFKRPYLKETQQTFNILQSQIMLELTGLKVGNVVNRYCVKGTVGSTVYADPNDTLLGGNTTRAEGPHVDLRINGTYDAFDAVYLNAQGLNKVEYGVESIPAGYVFIEPSLNGNPAEALNLVGAQSASLFVDPDYTGGNTNTVQVTTTEKVYQA